MALRGRTICPSVQHVNPTLSERKRVSPKKEQQFAFLHVCFNLPLAGWSIGGKRSRPCRCSSTAYCWHAHTPVGSWLCVFTACCLLGGTVLLHFPLSTVLQVLKKLLFWICEHKQDTGRQGVAWKEDVRASHKTLQASEVDSRQSSRLPHIVDPQTCLWELHNCRKHRFASGCEFDRTQAVHERVLWPIASARTTDKWIMRLRAGKARTGRRRYGSRGTHAGDYGGCESLVVKKTHARVWSPCWLQWEPLFSFRGSVSQIVATPSGPPGDA